RYTRYTHAVRHQHHHATSIHFILRTLQTPLRYRPHHLERLFVRVERRRHLQILLPLHRLRTHSRHDALIQIPDIRQTLHHVFIQHLHQSRVARASFDLRCDSLKLFLASFPILIGHRTYSFRAIHRSIDSSSCSSYVRSGQRRHAASSTELWMSIVWQFRPPWASCCSLFSFAYKPSFTSSATAAFLLTPCSAQ